MKTPNDSGRRNTATPESTRIDELGILVGGNVISIGRDVMGAMDRVVPMGAKDGIGIVAGAAIASATAGRKVTIVSGNVEAFSDCGAFVGPIVGVRVSTLAGCTVAIVSSGAEVGLKDGTVVGLFVGVDVMTETMTGISVLNVSNGMSVGATTGTIVGSEVTLRTGDWEVGDITGVDVVGNSVGRDWGMAVKRGGGGGTVVMSQQPSTVPKSFGQQLPYSSAH